MKTSCMFLSLLLFFSGLQACKKADPQPDWATGVVGTYKGNYSEYGYAATALVTRVDNSHVTVTLTTRPGTTYSDTYAFSNVTMTSATALAGKDFGYRKTHTTNLTGSFGGSSFSMTLGIEGYGGGGSTVNYIFTGTK